MLSIYDKQYKVRMKVTDIWHVIYAGLDFLWGWDELAKMAVPNDHLSFIQRMAPIWECVLSRYHNESEGGRESVKIAMDMWDDWRDVKVFDGYYMGVRGVWGDIKCVSEGC